MPTPYRVLYDGVLSKLISYDFLKITEEEVYSVLSEYLRPAIVNFQECKKDLSNRDDELGEFYDELSDTEIEILVDLMLIEYLKGNYINVPSMLEMILPSKDFHAFSPGNHLDKLISLIAMYKNEVRQLISFYSYIDSQLFS